jgi:hypothetical protein
MRQSKPIQLAIAVLGLLGWTTLAAAQPLPPLLGRPIPRSSFRVKNLDEASRRGLLYVGLESGRIKVEINRLPPTPSGQNSKPPDEQLTVRNSGGDFSIEYVKLGTDRRVSIEIGVSSRRVHIVQQPEAGADVLPVEFTQPPCGPLSLTLGARQSQRVIHGASLWHLMVGYPEICRQHLLPLLQLIDSRWDLGKLAADLEEDLIQLARSQDAPDRRHWDALVAQLRDERYTRREAADRQLRASGRIVIHYLRQLDPARLDAEQKFRVRRIIAALGDSEAIDTPDRVTSWLAGDPSIWLGLLSRDSESTRRLALQQLSSLLDKPLVFDPAADEKTRQSQVEQIRGLVKEN